MPIGTIHASFLVSTPASVVALLCRFSAAVSLQVMRWLYDLAQKLSVRVVEARTKSGECVCTMVACAGVCRCFKRVISHLGYLALYSAVSLLLCRCE